MRRLGRDRSPALPPPARAAALREDRRVRGQQARRRGRSLELLAALWLMLRGYRLIALRRKTHGVEVDLMVRRGPVLALVEVKARRTLEEALSAVTPAQQARLMRAAAGLAGQPSARGLDVRIDLLALVPRCWPRHVRAAWGGDGTRR